MKLENYFTANADLVHHFEHLPWGELGLDQAGVDGLRQVLTAAGEYIGREVAARAAEVDRLGTAHHPPIELSPPMRANLAGLAELGLTGMSVPVAYGGGGLPISALSMVIEMLARACPSTTVQFGFHAAPAALLLRFGSEEQRRRWIPPLAQGEISASVAMTEPQAGSDVGALRTRAERLPGGGYRLHGRKQFISNGASELSLVLARSRPESHGLQGLGLFLVPRRLDGRENFQVERAEEKVCLAGSPTCSLLFEGSEAELVGEEDGGWRAILSFMNESRVAVGLQAVGQLQASQAAADDYAAERQQMGRPIREYPLVAEILLDMEASLLGLRALAYEATYLEDRLALGLEGEGSAAAWRLREITPLFKYQAAEEAVRLSRLALQVHGGYGVVREYDVERFVRESLILPIYEGTSQIQALMAVKDLFRAVARRPLSLLDGGYSQALKEARLPRRWAGPFRRAKGELDGGLRRLAWRVGWPALRRQPDGEELLPILTHAERLTRMLAALHVARALAQRAQGEAELEALVESHLQRTANLCRALGREIAHGRPEVLAAVRRWRSGG